MLCLLAPRALEPFFVNSRKLLLVLALAVLVGGFFFSDLGRFFSLDYFKSQQAAIEAYQTAQPWLTVGFFFAVYAVSTALSLSLIHIYPASQPSVSRFAGDAGRHRKPNCGRPQPLY